MKHLIFLVAVSGLLFLNHEFSGEQSNFSVKKVYIPPPKSIQYLTFGYEDSIADSLWVRWIQNLDACGKQRISRNEFEKRYYKDHKKNDLDVSFFNLGYDRNQQFICDRGWSFQMLDVITDLTPRFRQPYVTGAGDLSVISNDPWGAKIIFDKGLQEYPNDWILLYRASYHYLYELDDLAKAADLLSRAGDHGAPSWVKSLSSRLYNQNGQLQLGIINLEEYLNLLLKEKKVDLASQVMARLSALKKFFSKDKRKKSGKNSVNPEDLNTL